MSNVTRGLFDPRQKMQHWPEPNDDPNIPYSWGESDLGYSIGGFRSNDSDPIEPSTQTQLDAEYEPGDDTEIAKPLSTNVNVRGDLNETAVSVAAATSIVLGLWGVVEGYSQSSNQGGERIFDSLEKGVIYATGVGFILCKTMKD
jgi:hypothetical protein